MKAQDERRNQAAADDEPLSPELIALLLMCGAEVRAADRGLEAANEPDAPERRRPERRRPSAG